MPSLDEMMGDLQTADAAGDTQLATHIAGLIKAQQHGAIAGEPDLGGFGNSVLGAGIGFVHNLPLVGDAAITAGRAINDVAGGRGFNWQQANNEAQQTIASSAQQHPITNTVGAVGGAVDSGIIGGAVLKSAGVAAPAALRLQQGQRLLNAGRLAVVGGAAAAAQGAVQGADEQLVGGHVAEAPAAAAKSALGAGAAGMLLGPAAGVGAAVGGRITGLVGRAAGMNTLDTKVAMALSRYIGETPADLQAAWSTFKANTGRPPIMAELASLKTAGQIKGAARDSTPISIALTDAQEDAARARSDNMQQMFTPQPQPAGATVPVPGGAPSPAGLSSGEVENVKTAQGDYDYSAARQHAFQIPTEDDPALGGVSPSDHLAAQVVPLAGLKTADKVRIVEGLKTGALSGQDAQLLRSKLGAAQGVGSNYSPAVASAMGDLDDFLQSPGNEAAQGALAQANANYVAGSQRQAGAVHGESILGAQTAPNFAAVAESKPNANPNFGAGMTGGAISKLADQASTPAGATSLAQQFATDDALHAKLSTVFGGKAADAFQRLGESETGAARNLAPYTNRTPNAPDQDAKDANTGLRALATFASHGVYKLYHGYKAIQGLGMSPAVQEKVAQYLSDPGMVPQGIAVLKKAGMTDTALRQMTLDVAQHVGAGAAGATNSVSESLK